MTIGQHISNLRDLIKQYSRNTEPYTDQFLYEVLSICRGDFLRQELKKFHNTDSSNYITFCMALEQSKSHNCDCVPTALNCLVVKSKYKIPNVLSSRNKNRLWAKTLGGKIINIIDERAWLRRKDLDTNEYFGSIINEYLFIWNAPLTLKVIEVTGLWSDPLDLQNIPNCNPVTGQPESTCYNILEADYPLHMEYASTVYKECLKFLQISLQVQTDTTNDSNDSIKI